MIIRVLEAGRLQGQEMELIWTVPIGLGKLARFRDDVRAMTYVTSSSPNVTDSSKSMLDAAER